MAITSEKGRDKTAVKGGYLLELEGKDPHFMQLPLLIVRRTANIYAVGVPKSERDHLGTREREDFMGWERGRQRDG